MESEMLRIAYRWGEEDAMLSSHGPVLSAYSSHRRALRGLRRTLFALVPQKLRVRIKRGFKLSLRYHTHDHKIASAVICDDGGLSFFITEEHRNRRGGRKEQVVICDIYQKYILYVML